MIWGGGVLAERQLKQDWISFDQAQARYFYRNFLFVRGLRAKGEGSTSELLARAAKSWGGTLRRHPEDRQAAFAAVISLQAAGRNPDYRLIRPARRDYQLERDLALQSLVVDKKPDRELLVVPGVKEFIDRSPVRRLWLATIYERQGRRDEAKKQWHFGFLEAAPFVFPLYLIMLLWGLAALAGFILLLTLAKKRFPRPEADQPSLRLGLASGALALGFLLQFVLSPLVYGAHKLLPGGGDVVGNLLLSFLSALGVLLLLGNMGFAPGRLGLKRFAPFSSYFGLALAVFFIGIVGMLLASLLQQFWSRETREPSLLMIATVKSLPLRVLVVVMGCTLIPFAEETLFRGILFRGLRTQWGVWAGAIISSAFFAGLHADLMAAVPIFIFSLGLCWSVQRTGSLIPAMLAHGLFNLFPLLAVNFMTM